MDPFIGEIRPYPYDFVPQGWAPCDGRPLKITQYATLYSLIGTAFGGDGRSTFALPNLAGVVPIGTGQAIGGADWSTGQTAGETSVTLSSGQMAAHTHTLNATSAGATGTNAPGQQLALASNTNDSQGSTDVMLYSASAPGIILDPDTLVAQGGGQGHPNLMPYLALNYCIALTGIVPSRP